MIVSAYIFCIMAASIIDMLPPSAVYEDLHSFDLSTLAWTLLSPTADRAQSTPARYGHGFTSAAGKLYVHGGGSFGGDEGSDDD
jgi:hypothetical protein